MMHPLLTSWLNDAHRRDLLAEAEAARKAAEIQADRSSALPAHAAPRCHPQVLRRASDLLIATGMKLRLVPGPQRTPIESACCSP